MYRTFNIEGHAVALLVETLRQKLDGRGFDSRWGHLDLALGSTQPLTEIR